MLKLVMDSALGWARALQLESTVVVLWMHLYSRRVVSELVRFVAEQGVSLREFQKVVLLQLLSRGSPRWCPWFQAQWQVFVWAMPVPPRAQGSCRSCPWLRLWPFVSGLWFLQGRHLGRCHLCQRDYFSC